MKLKLQKICWRQGLGINNRPVCMRAGKSMRSDCPYYQALNMLGPSPAESSNQSLSAVITRLHSDYTYLLNGIHNMYDNWFANKLLMIHMQLSILWLQYVHSPHCSPYAPTLLTISPLGFSPALRLTLLLVSKSCAVTQDSLIKARKLRSITHSFHY